MLLVFILQILFRVKFKVSGFRVFLFIVALEISINFKDTL